MKLQWFTDPKTHHRSATLTVAVLGTFACLLKLMMSGMVIHGFTIEAFSGTEFAAALSAVWAPYGFRKWSDKGTDAGKSIKLSSEDGSKPPVEGAGN